MRPVPLRFAALGMTAVLSLALCGCGIKAPPRPPLPEAQAAPPAEKSDAGCCTEPPN